MSFKSYQSYRIFSNHVRYNSRYVQDDDTKFFLSEVLNTGKGRIKKLPQGKELWRSQLGMGSRPIYHDDDEKGEPYDFEPAPHPEARMKPLKGSASEGRVNPKGISYIYLAEDQQTAMSEARPWVGSLVSVAKFVVMKDLNIIDCSLDTDSSPFYFDVDKGIYEPNDEKKKDAVWSNIDRAFSEPVSPNENNSCYVPTQIIAELFKCHGYDGVAYRSTLTDKLNICLFDMEVVEIKECQLFETEKVDFKFKEETHRNKRTWK